MNRERAEIHLRLVAEAELRRARTPPQDGAVVSPEMPGAEHEAVVSRQRSVLAAALYDLPVLQRQVIALQYYAGLSDYDTASTVGMSGGAVHAFTSRGEAALRAALGKGATRVSWVAQALTAVGALDRDVADQVLDEFALALGLQQAGSAGQRGPDLRSLMRSPVAHLPLNMLLSFRPSEAFIRVAARSVTAVAAGAPGSSGPRTPPYLAMRVGQVIPVRAEDVSGEMYLLSYAQTESSARFTVVVRARGEFVPPRIEHSGMYRPFAVFPVHEFIATDDQGTSYPMDFSGWRGSRATELTGEIILQPGPPAGRRWLDLSTGPGEPAVRIDLDQADRPPAAADVTVREATASPGEHLLNNVATRLLLLAVAFPQEVWLHPAAQRQGPLTYTADGLGDMVTALQACGALSPFSPVPGRLAALCARLNVTGHDIAVPPARELPEPWLSLLAHYHRRQPEASPGPYGCAAAAVMFPELDGIRLAVLGLHHSDAGTVLFVLVSGLMPRGPNGPPCVPPDFWPRIWVRDSGGRWHATRTGVWTEEDDEVMMRLEVVPPLSHATTWIDVVAAGPSAEFRATLPLRWQ